MTVLNVSMAVTFSPQMFNKYLAIFRPSETKSWHFVWTKCSVK